MSLVADGSERWRRLCGCRREQVTLRPEMEAGRGFTETYLQLDVGKRI